MCSCVGLHPATPLALLQRLVDEPQELWRLLEGPRAELGFFITTAKPACTWGGERCEAPPLVLGDSPEPKAETPPERAEPVTEELALPPWQLRWHLLLPEEEAAVEGETRRGRPSVGTANGGTPGAAGDGQTIALVGGPQGTSRVRRTCGTNFTSFRLL